VRIVGVVLSVRVEGGGRVQRCPVDGWRRKSAEDGYVSLGVSAVLFREIAYCRRRRPSSGAVCALAIALVDFSRAADKQRGLCHIRSSADHVRRLFTPAAQWLPSPFSGTTQCTTDGEVQTTCLVHASEFDSCPSSMYPPVCPCVPRCSLPHACPSGTSPTRSDPDDCTRLIGPAR
jgi:hypothetical protein